MERYVIRQEQTEVWTISHNEQSLYVYPTEDEARVAALALVKDAAGRGVQAAVLVLPHDTSVEVEDERPRRRYSGM